jgi:DNA mismatch repair protein MutS2
LVTLYPKDFFEKIEFNKVLKSIKEECQGEQGNRYFDHIPILEDKNEISNRLEEVDEWKKAIERGANIPMGPYEDINQDLFLLSKEGYVLEVESIQRIHRIAYLGIQISNFFQDYTVHKIMPHLTKLGLSISLDPKLIKEIERVFDEEGNVRPNASDTLSKLSKSIGAREREVDKVFRQELLSYRDKGYLVEGMESIKNGRSVLMVAAEHKRKVAGIIHDESSTGKTVYIEPERTLALNNEVHNLYAERRSEIYKIVKELCSFIRPFKDHIDSAALLIINFDTIRAKARYALRVKASKPLLVTKPTICFKEAFNPVLFLKMKETDEKIIPFNLELLHDNRFLILSGPNAGGKSVALKTIGLLQIMVQAGIPVPANENSKFGIFKRIYADIGDQQSIEDDLSTYSSHLANMKKVIDEADESSLILIDEFGSGTDPKIGGGIAEAILKYLQDKKCFGFVTTHYSNLKFFAYKNKGFVNGCMEFDMKLLKPTYQMIVGKPGSSFAFEIAEKTGLPSDVIDYAKKRAGKHEQSIEEMLISLQSERQEFEQKMAKVMEKEERLDKLMKTYDTMHGELELKRKKLKLDQKQAVAFQNNEIQKELAKKIKELKSLADAEAAQKKLEEKKKEAEVIVEQIDTIKTELYKHEVRNQNEVKIGEYAQMRNSNSIGKVLSIEKDMAELELGFFKIKVPLKELIPSVKPIEIQSQRSINTSQISTTPRFETKLDLRGYRVEDAMSFLQDFLDKAIISNAHELRIIHGVGNGTLKRNVYAKIKEYKDIKEYWHPEENLGGEGVTYVKL